MLRRMVRKNWHLEEENCCKLQLAWWIQTSLIWVLFGAVLIIMAHSPDKIKSIDGSKETLKLSVRISDLWFIGTPNKSEQAEMVFVDFDGDEIHVVYVIGVVEEVVFRQVSGKGRRVVFKLKDLSQQLLSCTSWDDYCLQFLKFLDDYEGDGPITVLLSHCRIKEAQGSYPASISNSFKASKLIINQPVMEIQEFNERLAELGIEARSGFKSHGEGSTQLSGSIQLSSKEALFGKAKAKSIANINTISEEIVCVTIGTITRIVLDNHSWCYTTCIQCHKKSDAEMAPFTCACGKYNKEVVLRYRLEVMINQGNESTKFLLWDHKGATQVRNFVVLKCLADSSLINVVMDMLADAEQSLTVTSDHDPLLGLPLTPTKRQTFQDCDDEVGTPQISPAQLSPNKLKKHGAI
ncbi:hypothetical protein D0Y65_017603 [Glycine soja]|uniref:Replication factor A C-terminal domain-containing protein n=1 Tax=Glycine soja TaxID=3848 RepID=A0A445JVK1_GLYSO|nr:hypothetical protein D0Y65_017603 [Glycine soja]